MSGSLKEAMEVALRENPERIFKKERIKEGVVAVSAAAKEVQIPVVDDALVAQMAAESAAWREAACANGKKLAIALFGVFAIERDRRARSNPSARKMLDQFRAAQERLTKSDNPYFLEQVRVATLFELVRAAKPEWDYFAFVAKKFEEYGRGVIKDKDPDQKSFPSGPVVTAQHIICYVEGGEQSRTNHGLFKELRGLRDRIRMAEQVAEKAKIETLRKENDVSDNLQDLICHVPGRYRICFAERRDPKTNRQFREGLGIVELTYDKGGHLELQPVDGAGSLAGILELAEKRFSVPVVALDFGKLPNWFPSSKRADAEWFISRVRSAIRTYRQNGKSAKQAGAALPAKQTDS